MIILKLNNEAKFDIHKKEREGLLYENGAGKKNVGHSKVK